MEFNPEDFKKLKFDPYNLIWSKPATKRYPEIGEREAFSSVNRIAAGVSKDNVVRYILFLYQKGSPLLEIRDRTKARVEAAKLSRFDMNEDGTDFTGNYKDVMLCRNEVSNKMIVDFCRMQNDHAFASYALYNDLLYIQMEWTLNNQDDPSKTKSAIANIKEVNKVLGELRKELLMDEESTDVFKTMLEMIEMEEVHLRREDIAAALARGEDPLSDYAPYGKDYNFQKNPDINEKMYMERKSMNEEG
jgi:hypothetical protein